MSGLFRKWCGVKGVTRYAPDRRIGAMRDVELYRVLLRLTGPWAVRGRRRGPDGTARRGASRRGSGTVPLSGVRDAGAVVRQQAPPAGGTWT